jgi:antitoxin component of RelBE/YafQ-DinJ toxin-antitoxin module
VKKDKTLLIRLEKEKHIEYKNLCKKHGLNMSQRFRNFINNEIKLLKDKK